VRLWVPMVCLACGVASTTAGPLHHKPSTPDYPIAALRKFAAAVVLEREGRYHDAYNEYYGANEVSPQAATYYDMAVVELELEHLDSARQALAKYLELAPKATDHAEVEHVLAELTQRPQTIWISSHDFKGSEPGDIVLLDGIPVGEAPILVHPGPGRHIVERLGPKGYARRYVNSTPGHAQVDEHLDLTPATGNVLIDGETYSWSPGASWTEGETNFVLDTYFSLAIGHYKTTMQIHAGMPTCAPVEFDVKSTTELTHVHVDVDAVAAQHNTNCVPVTKVIVNQPLRSHP
jgi:tetratricopeptide (TPR) repeat protein